MKSRRDAIASVEKKHQSFREAFAAREGVAVEDVPPIDDETTWGIADVARYLDVGELTVRKLTIEDGLPYAKVGRLLRFKRVWVDEWLERKRRRG